MVITNQQGLDKENLLCYNLKQMKLFPRCSGDLTLAVGREEAEFLLVMSPTRMEQVQACTAAGEKMPQKSTAFYPKVISGLVMMPAGAEERV